MYKKLAAFAAVAAVTAVIVSIASAGAVATKQRVAIVHQGSSFVVIPLTSGAVRRDTGIVTFCCWSDRHAIRDGQAIEINDPEMTLTGKRGTLIVRNRIAWVDVSDGLSLFTGTWKVERGTGQYAGLGGGGRGAGVQSTSDGERARFEGFLRSR
jgi:hypothetical protein